jgi:hypothetical protein
MSIQLVDNFQLNSAIPIDTRIVASGSAERDAIQYKYEGLRVYDLSNNSPYVWINGGWFGENSLSIYGFGAPNYIVKYSGSGTTPVNTISQSIITEQNVFGEDRVGIGTINFGPAPFSKLQVAGSIRAEGGVFYGSGAGLTNIPATQITGPNSLSINLLQLYGGVNWIMVNNSSSAIWKDPAQITVGNATNAQNSVNATNAVNADKVAVKSNSTNSSTNYVLFSQSTGSVNSGVDVLTNTTNSIRINPNNGKVGIGTGTLTGKLSVVNLTGTSVSATPTLTNPSSLLIAKDDTNMTEANAGFRIETSQYNSVLRLRKYIGTTGVRDSSWGSYGGSSGEGLDEIRFHGRTYINTKGDLNTGDVLSFGTNNSLATNANDQIVFYLKGPANATLTSQGTQLPTIGGKGVLVQYNARVNGIMSAGSYDLIGAPTTMSLNSFVDDGGAFRSYTNCLSTTQTVLFGFGGASNVSYLYLDIAYDPTNSLSGASLTGANWIPLDRRNVSSPTALQATVMVPKGYRVRISKNGNAAAGQQAYIWQIGVN